MGRVYSTLATVLCAGALIYGAVKAGQINEELDNAETDFRTALKEHHTTGSREYSTDLDLKERYFTKIKRTQGGYIALAAMGGLVGCVLIKRESSRRSLE